MQILGHSHFDCIMNVFWGRNLDMVNSLIRLIFSNFSNLVGELENLEQDFIGEQYQLKLISTAEY